MRNICLRLSCSRPQRVWNFAGRSRVEWAWSKRTNASANFRRQWNPTVPCRRISLEWPLRFGKEFSTMSDRRIVRAPRGSDKSCKGWHQEAALRMLMNNLDPEVAENPDRLIVYGGTRKAARSWAAFDAIVAALRKLRDDETLLVQSGKPVGVVRTHALAPRGLIAHS